MEGLEPGRCRVLGVFVIGSLFNARANLPPHGPGQHLQANFHLSFAA